jgi:hypothetical protein
VADDGTLQRDDRPAFAQRLLDFCPYHKLILLSAKTCSLSNRAEVNTAKLASLSWKFMRT